MSDERGREMLESQAWRLLYLVKMYLLLNKIVPTGKSVDRCYKAIERLVEVIDNTLLRGGTEE